MELGVEYYSCSEKPKSCQQSVGSTKSPVIHIYAQNQKKKEKTLKSLDHKKLFLLLNS
ncbi:hypothetical protein NC652_039334 [Populus alba x Populus x berolinensis]|nr:hypothetical protein NC652_039334 [Populus alba x Populus x berolinensis]